MDSQLALMQSAVRTRTESDTFIRLQACADGQELVIEPLWTTPGVFVLRLAKQKAREISQADVPALLTNFLGGKTQATITCVERNQETIIELSKGKVRVRSTPKQQPEDRKSVV